MPTMPTAPSFEVLNGIPPIDIPRSIQAALATGRRASGIAAEAVALRLGPCKISPQEYFYYRLWDERVRLGPAKAFVGKMAQHPMHVAAGRGQYRGRLQRSAQGRTVAQEAGEQPPCNRVPLAEVVSTMLTVQCEASAHARRKAAHISELLAKATTAAMASS